MSYEDDASYTTQTVSRNYCKFYPKWKRNNFKSEAEGREVGEYVDMILIISPGQNKDEHHSRVTPEHIKEFPEQWRAYKDGKEQRLSGTPVELLPGLPAGVTDMMKANYIHTVEQLSDLSEPARQKLGMGAGEWVKLAKTFLQKGTGDTIALKAENAELRAQLAALSEQVAALSQRSKPGRKKRILPPELMEATQ